MANQDHQEMTFNTQRPYAEEGQIITAKVLEDDGVMKRVHFSDKTRYIDGVISVAAFTEDCIMKEYDAGNYQSA